MITLQECAEFAALETSELFTGALLSARHRSLLSSYLLNLMARAYRAAQDDRLRHSYGD